VAARRIIRAERIETLDLRFTIYDIRVGRLAMAAVEHDESGAIRLDWVGLGDLFKKSMLKVLFLSFLFKSMV